jgi:hypothetical protein
VAALERDLQTPLRAEGVTDLVLSCVATNATSWDQHAPGFDEVSLPIMIDTAGVFYIYSADSYEMILIDRKGRLVTKEIFSEAAVVTMKQRIREVHAE